MSARHHNNYTINKSYKKAQKKLQQACPSGIETYKKLNESSPFILSFGTAMCQTKETNNTKDKEFIRKSLQQQAKKEKKPEQWLSKKQGYVLYALPQVTCKNCNQTTNPSKLDLKHDTRIIKNIITDSAQQKHSATLSLKHCPHCHSDNITEQAHEKTPFSTDHENAMIDQIKALHVEKQNTSLPSYRLSIDIADILKPNSLDIDTCKLNDLSSFLQRCGNTLTCMHHYTNPTSYPTMFEKKQDAHLFAQWCKQIVEKNQNLTHVCPMSQVFGYGMRMSREKNFPPFTCNLETNEFLENLVEANVEASKAIKAVNPNIQILISHQWKPFKPMHRKIDPRCPVEAVTCKFFAHRMYTEGFINLFKDKQDHFDGLALSIYPSCQFNMVTPVQDNCSGSLDPAGALESLVQAHKAFPTKDIYIAETGCNSPDPEVKKKFIDTTLYVCLLAKEMGIPVKGCYLWGHTNDRSYYYEWGALPGSSHFGPYDKLDTQNPTASMNESGRYIKKIIDATYEAA